MAERAVGDIVESPAVPADPAVGITPLHVSQSLEDGLASFKDQQVSGLPVVDDGGVVGSITAAEVIWSVETDAELGPAIRAISADISPNDRMFAIEVSAFYLGSEHRRSGASDGRWAWLTSRKREASSTSHAGMAVCCAC